MRFEVLIALRYLRARRKKTFVSLISLLSMAGVALGVAALIVVLSVMGGFETEIRRAILGQNAHVHVYRVGRAMTDFDKVMTACLADPEVVAAAPFVHGQVMVVSDYGATGGLMRGLSVDKALKVMNIEQTIKSGSFKDLTPPWPEGIPGVVIGKAMARQLGAGLGSVINIINPLGEDTPVGRIPKSEPFRVVGLFHSGLHQYDASVIYTSLRAAQDLMDLGGAVNGVDLKVKDIFQAEKVGRSVGGKLGPGYYTRDWMSNNQSLFAALKLEKFGMFVVLILIVVVAAFGIVSSLVMLVMEKSKDIAILKAMGATAASIRRIFTIEGLIVGFWGTFLGLWGGLGLCWLLSRYQFIDLPKNVYPMNTMPVQVEPHIVAIVAVSAVLICLLATLYPARNAGKTDPVEALRYE
ncbi:lipoprotein-releasing ABC transporter permease subunit [Dethiosulfatarculus sandiegensis]|uniref:ABC transporter permease n=1 Tax=Dethiosulfatarculus sandiegensis TaxID=1429043 RepID=A0A0D2HQZ4_9BACT|nr:lipoprotein-releasing ABC transporter permease subunit [Dethiosulfatarculus sandiegensis]KIX12903.1 ABC transporter permease [Dethiosulfatarculus sandiegensis]